VNRFLQSRMLRSMIPHFILGLMLIIAFRVTTEVAFFSDHISTFFSRLTPFLMGGILGYILNMPCSAIQRLLLKIQNGFVQKRSRAISVLLTILLVIALISLVLNLVIPAVTRSVVMFVNELPNYEQTFRTWIMAIEEWDLPEFIPDINEDAIFGAIGEFAAGLNMEAIMASVFAGFGNIATAVFQVFLATVTSIYILVEKDRLKSFALRFLAAVAKPSTYNAVLKYTGKLNFNFYRYIYTQTIDGIILGSLMTIFLLIIGQPHALVLGLILGVVNYIPYFGSIFGTILAVIVVAFTQGLPTAGVAAVIMLIIQQTDGNFIQPKLMGGSFSLSPLLIIMSVTVGGAYAGVLGMLVAIPIVAIFKDILDEYIAYREAKKLEDKSPEDDFMNFEL